LSYTLPRRAEAHFVLAPFVALGKVTQEPLRLSTRQLLRRLKGERRDAPADPPNFDQFALHVARTMKLPNRAVSLDHALHHAFN